MKGWILILALVILTGTAVYLLRPPDVETVQAKRRLAAAVLSKMEKDLSEWPEEVLKFQNLKDALYARYTSTVVKRDRLKRTCDLAKAPEDIVVREAILAEEIGHMEEDQTAWVEDGKREELHLESLLAEREHTPPEKAEALRRDIEASKKKCKEIAGILEEAAEDIEQAKQKVGR